VRTGPARSRPQRPLLAAVAILAACGPSSRPTPAGAPRGVVFPVVARDAVLVPAGTVPDALVAELAGARVVLFGEIHYAEEHQAFLVALLARLQTSGFRLVLEEAMHATAWTGEEYIQLRSMALPPHLARFDLALLDGLRALNAGLPEADRIHFGGFDMNNWSDAFQAGAGEFQARFGHVAVLDDVMAASPGSTAYAAALRAVPARLATDAAA
jgi:erythromycin esterase-like protein